jgi:choline-sulfatase
VSQVSLMATLLELCGIAVPERLDGAPLTPYLTEPAKISQDPVYAQFALRTKNSRAMIRKGIWKYSHYSGDTPELYNLRDDPDEMNNVALNPAYKPRLEALRADLLRWSDPAAV